VENAIARTQVRFKNILFATDFSPAAAHAIPYVKEIAEHYNADLVTLYVRPPVVNLMTPAVWPVEIDAGKAEDEKHREEVLKTFVGIRTQALIEEGDIQACLAAAIEKNNTDLVVVGTRGRNGIGKLLLGSVAEEILRTAPCPVLTVGPHSDCSRGPTGGLREILYATDLSPESQAAAAYALSLAEEFESQLILLHVVPEPKPEDRASAFNVEATLNKLVCELVPPDAEVLKPEYYVEGGDPAKKILEFAELRQVDLIVLGARAEKRLRGAAMHLETAIAHRVASHADCPVLTVRH
jgi:nucleotide-binding universal stress UspA family protein